MIAWLSGVSERAGRFPIASDDVREALHPRRVNVSSRLTNVICNTNKSVRGIRPKTQTFWIKLCARV